VIGCSENHRRVDHHVDHFGTIKNARRISPSDVSHHDQKSNLNLLNLQPYVPRVGHTGG